MSSDTSAARARLARSVKAYDVRGLYPDDLDEEVARALGAAFIDGVVRQHSPGGPLRVVVARDMRTSGEALAESFALGARSAGADVFDAGLCSTDELYFASGHLKSAGAMFTASHNPAVYNGVKLCLPNARPVGQETGLRETADRADSILAGGLDALPEQQRAAERIDMLRPYAERLRSLVGMAGARHMKVVVDAGNGMAGLTVPAVLGTAAGLPDLPIEIIPMYFDLDGSFPNHEANPLVPSNTEALQAEVIRAGADLGLAFDGDADRCFFIDECGERVDPSVITTLIGLREAAASGDAEPVVLHNAITSRSVPETLSRHGVRAVRTRVGHSFIKTVMACENAVFGGEHSGHFYFRDFFGADSGMLAALHVIKALATSEKPFSQFIRDIDPYVRSGEIDIRVDDVVHAQDDVLHALRDRFSEDLDVDYLDGLTAAHWHGDVRWWVNVRPSNTESLLRVNIEGADTEAMRTVRDVVIAALERASAR